MDADVVAQKDEALKAVGAKVREGYAVVSQDGFAYQSGNDSQTYWLTDEGDGLSVSLEELLTDYAVGARRFEEWVQEFEPEEFARVVTKLISEIEWAGTIEADEDTAKSS